MVISVLPLTTSKNKIFPVDNISDLDRNSVHRSLTPILFISQCFCQIPVAGITGHDPKSLKFTWMSWRVLYCLLNCAIFALMCVLYFYRFGKYGTNLYQISAVTFNASALISCLLFLRLATGWPDLMRRWRDVELSMRSYGCPKRQRFRLNALTFTIFSIAALDYLLSQVSKMIIAIKCKGEDQELMFYFYTAVSFDQIFGSIPYALWKGILLQFANLLGTFSWTFIDVFVMLMSSIVALRFRQITERLQKLNQIQKLVSVTVWRTVREDYNRLSQFTKQLDDELSYIIVMSFASNLFFILIQLFNSLRAMKQTLEKVYFFVSFGFVILRTILVSIYGAWIYDESKEPSVYLNSVSSDVYNIEIKRFIEQVKFDMVAITGRNFFVVTRGIVLSMAGAIVTYELVLIQFNENLLRESAMAANTSSDC